MSDKKSFWNKTFLQSHALVLISFQSLRIWESFNYNSLTWICGFFFFSCRNKDIWIFGWWVFFQFLRMVINFIWLSYSYKHIFFKNHRFNFCSVKINNHNLCIYFLKEAWIYFILIIFYLDYYFGDFQSYILSGVWAFF